MDPSLYWWDKRWGRWGAQKFADAVANRGGAAGFCASGGDGDLQIVEPQPGGNDEQETSSNRR